MSHERSCPDKKGDRPSTMLPGWNYCGACKRMVPQGEPLLETMRNGEEE